MEIVPFDLHRMFIGDLPPLFLLEIVFRTFVIYVYTLFAIRYIGKRGMAQLTPFEFVVIIVLGSAAGDPMLYGDVPLLHGMAVITIVVLMHKILNSFTNHSEKLEQLVESKSVKLIQNGEIISEALENESISKQEFFMQLRMKEVKNVGEVESAYIEPSGDISIFKYKETDRKNGLSTLP